MLRPSCPDLTRTEMQLAAMLRLNLTSKEIAHVLNQSIASIDKTRHQLRQKLRLKTGKNLGVSITDKLYNCADPVNIIGAMIGMGTPFSEHHINQERPPTDMKRLKALLAFIGEKRMYLSYSKR